MKKLVVFIVLILCFANQLVRAEEKSDSLKQDIVLSPNPSQQEKSGAPSNDKTVTKEELIAIMNYCTYSLTTILADQSMIVLDKEQDILENNLRIKPTAKMDKSVQRYLTKMLKALQQLKLSTEEYEVLQRVSSIKNDNRKWKALSSSLNNVLFLFPGSVSPQLIFQGLLTVARGVVEYAVMTNEASAEELLAMWDFRKQKLKTLNELNAEAFDLIQELFRTYYDLLDDNDRLTKADMESFVKIVNNPDPELRLNKFNASHNEKLKILPAYWYHKGMAYIDMGQDNIKQAMQCFAVYEEMFKKAPILYKDRMLGCIGLSYLAYRDDLSSEQKRYYAQVVVDNLPFSVPAIIQSSISFRSSGDMKNAYKVVKDVLVEEKLEDKDALILYSASLAPYLCEKDVALMERLINKMNGPSVNAIAGYYILRSQLGSSRLDSLDVKLNALIRPNVSMDGLEVNQSLFYDFSQMDLIKIEKDLEGQMRLYKGRLSWANCFKKDKLTEKFDFFKNKETELFKFVAKVYGAGDNAYVVKKNLDFNDIISGNGPANDFYRHYFDSCPKNKDKKEKAAKKMCKSLSETLKELQGDSNNIVILWDEAADADMDSLYRNKLEWGGSYVRIDLKGEQCPITLLYKSQVDNPIFYGTPEEFKSYCHEKDDVPEPIPSKPWWRRIF